MPSEHGCLLGATSACDVTISARPATTLDRIRRGTATRRRANMAFGDPPHGGATSLLSAGALLRLRADPRLAEGRGAWRARVLNDARRLRPSVACVRSDPGVLTCGTG